MGKLKIIRFFNILLFCFILISSTSWAAEKKEPPVYVEADQMSSTEDNNSVLFTGNVDAKQGDLRILSDKMTVYYHDIDEKEKASGTQQKIEKLICQGNVELSTPEWLGTAEEMIYYSGNRKIDLLGNAKAWQGENMIAGDKIIYYIDEGRSEVVGGATTVVGEGEEKEEKKSRVKMTILQN